MRGKIGELTGQSLLSLLRIDDDRTRWTAVTMEASAGVHITMLGATRR